MLVTFVSNSTPQDVFHFQTLQTHLTLTQVTPLNYSFDVQLPLEPQKALYNLFNFQYRHLETDFGVLNQWNPSLYQ